MSNIRTNDPPAAGPYKLTARGVARAALEAWRDGRLGFQMPKMQLVEGCHYRYPNSTSCCAVGAALPDSVVKGLTKSQGAAAVSTLFDEGEFITDSEDEAKTIVDIQVAHDELCYMVFSRANQDEPWCDHADVVKQELTFLNACRKALGMGVIRKLPESRTMRLPKAAA